ncbi:MAG: hypothetical protein H5T95_07095 [Firmicutes bacterium]|nr:hypothetical protein [Bacillota bacterium]
MAMPKGGARRHGVRRLCSEQAVSREFLAGWVGRIWVPGDEILSYGFGEEAARQ